MKIFHGSHMAIQKPDLSFARDMTDFGTGFYTTTIQSQAVKWAERYKRKQGSGVISVYETDVDELRRNVSVLEFDTYSVEWLDFIVRCRQGQPVEDTDLVIGGIANDDVFNTLTLYSRGFIEKTEAIKRLKFTAPNIQYCFKSQAVIDKYLLYTGNINI